MLAELFFIHAAHQERGSGKNIISNNSASWLTVQARQNEIILGLKALRRIRQITIFNNGSNFVMISAWKSVAPGKPKVIVPMRSCCPPLDAKKGVGLDRVITFTDKDLSVGKNEMFDRLKIEINNKLSTKTSELGLRHIEVEVDAGDDADANAGMKGNKQTVHRSKGTADKKESSIRNMLSSKRRVDASNQNPKGLKKKNLVDELLTRINVAKKGNNREEEQRSSSPTLPRGTGRRKSVTPTSSRPFHDGGRDLKASLLLGSEALPGTLIFGFGLASFRSATNRIQRRYDEVSSTKYSHPGEAGKRAKFIIYFGTSGESQTFLTKETQERVKHCTRYLYIQPSTVDEGRAFKRRRLDDARASRFCSDFIVIDDSGEEG